MNNGIFKRLDSCGYARAADVMSTQSATCFEWSVKLIGDSNFYVGIASHHRRKDNVISTSDPTSITYYSNNGEPLIKNGSVIIHRNLPMQKTGDIIRFKFQPHTKKLVIVSVRFFKVEVLKVEQLLN